MAGMGGVVHWDQPRKNAFAGAARDELLHGSRVSGNHRRDRAVMGGHRDLSIPAREPINDLVYR
ncbi:hypothetical protein MMEU_2470 [Mycobacterium marinum str. Europe]|nr:hypothetical protein MMEU_2470 [Mycobacterium marinum str. Europe]